MSNAGSNRHGIDKPKSICCRTYNNFIKTGNLVVIGKRIKN
ncbi:hypothetical protein [Aeromonas phage SW69-9]|nr:hypothetical protein [Aeromonas phage Riv-10]APU02335.1 hypothetical protein [Aeromonas phage SW69-9]